PGQAIRAPLRAIHFLKRAQTFMQKRCTPRDCFRLLTQAHCSPPPRVTKQSEWLYTLEALMPFCNLLHTPATIDFWKCFDPPPQQVNTHPTQPQPLQGEPNNVL
ncbi:MAG: hypothetical protein AAGJ35_06330, partial [Myxococcota bacterium]